MVISFLLKEECAISDIMAPSNSLIFVLMLFAKNEATHKYLSGLFEERKIEKY